MRYILFLAALGVVWAGTRLSAGNPAASVFQAAVGGVGYRFFGVVLWIAGITSVIGASYTSVSFWKNSVPFVQKYEKAVISLFIITSTIIFVFVGSPVKLLVLAGAVNGVILPIALSLILIAALKPAFRSQYSHPVWMQAAGWLVVAVMGWMSVLTIAYYFSA